MPWPSSTLPLAMETVPSGSKCTRCDRRRASESGGGFSASIEDRLDHAVVRTAAAQILVEGGANFAFPGFGVVRKQSHGCHDDTAHAVAALRGLVPLERLLHRVLAAEGFDGRHFLAGDKRYRQVARRHRAPVDQHET